MCKNVETSDIQFFTMRNKEFIIDVFSAFLYQGIPNPLFTPVVRLWHATHYLVRIM